MNTQSQTSNQPAGTEPRDELSSGLSEKLFLCLFVLIFVGFGLFLIGDFLAAFLR